MTKGDKILIIMIVIISLTSMVITKSKAIGSNEKYVSIQVNGEEIKKILFDKSVIGKTIPIDTEYGYNLVEIGDGKVRVIEADCPDKVDVKQGYISLPNELIVCLPNRLVIEIKGSEEIETEIIDHISH